MDMTTQSVKIGRIDTIDFLRGFVLILMALDHTRYFFSNVEHPLDFDSTFPLFF